MRRRRSSGEVVTEAVLRERTTGDGVAGTLVGDDEGEGASLQEAVKLLINLGG